MSREVILLPVSEVNAPGLLTGGGWRAVLAASDVYVSCAHPAWAAHLREVSVEFLVPDVTELREAIRGNSHHSRTPPGQPDESDQPGESGQFDVQKLAQILLKSLSGTDAVWILDAPLVHQLWPVLNAAADNADLSLNILFASPELPGAQVQKVAHTIDTLRGPKGCPWVQSQTHESVLKYVIEEAYEVTEAYESPLADPVANRAHVVQELGDLLFQVLLHARLGSEEPLAYRLDDAAAALHDKLVRRNPHVFEPESGDLIVHGPENPMPSLDAIVAAWNRIKAGEKGIETSHG